jgi:hypothetical protein
VGFQLGYCSSSTRRQLVVAASFCLFKLRLCRGFFLGLSLEDVVFCSCSFGLRKMKGGMAVFLLFLAVVGCVSLGAESRPLLRGTMKNLGAIAGLLPSCSPEYAPAPVDYYPSPSYSSPSPVYSSPSPVYSSPSPVYSSPSPVYSSPSPVYSSPSPVYSSPSPAYSSPSPTYSSPSPAYSSPSPVYSSPAPGGY